MKKYIRETRYIIIGSNNFWYASDDTLKDAKESLADIKKNYKRDYDFRDPESGYSPEKPKEFMLFESRRIK